MIYKDFAKRVGVFSDSVNRGSNPRLPANKHKGPRKVAPLLFFSTFVHTQGQKGIGIWPF